MEGAGHSWGGYRGRLCRPAKALERLGHQRQKQEVRPSFLGRAVGGAVLAGDRSCLLRACPLLCSPQNGASTKSQSIPGSAVKCPSRMFGNANVLGMEE